MFGFKFRGIRELLTVGEEIGEDVDICGCAFNRNDVWHEQAKLIPPFEELEAVKLEGLMDSDVTLGEAIGEQKADELRDLMDGGK